MSSKGPSHVDPVDVSDVAYSKVASWAWRVHRVLGHIEGCASTALRATLKASFDLRAITNHEYRQVRVLNAANGSRKHFPDRAGGSPIAWAMAVVERLALFDAPCGPFPSWELASCLLSRANGDRDSLRAFPVLTSGTLGACETVGHVDA